MQAKGVESQQPFACKAGSYGGNRQAREQVRAVCRAAEPGLVQKVTEPAALLDHCNDMAARLAGAAPLAVAAILETVHRGLDQPLDHALALEAGRFALLCSSEDPRESTGAFLEKRARG